MEWSGNVVELIVADLCHGFLMIFEYCKCYTFARIICGVCLYRLCIDMKHFSLFVMYGMMVSGHIDEAITS